MEANQHPSKGAFLSYSVDLIGTIRAALTRLRGGKNLILEFLQNADDAGDGSINIATALNISLEQDYLEIQNDGEFSECSDITAEACSMEASAGHRCDFHRFRNVLASDKQAEREKTGAFGLGFTSVFQITDAPELYASRFRLVVRPEQREDQRIALTTTACREKGTRFRLPFAFDDSSFLRSKLQDHIVTRDISQRLRDDFEQTLPGALLFLKHIRYVTLSVGGIPKRSWQRTSDGEKILLFSEAECLRHLHISARATIPPNFGLDVSNRSGVVAIALPVEGDPQGLFYCTLPTRLETRLGFHIDGSFFPTADREDLELEGFGQKPEWNKLLIKTAATAFAESLTALRDKLTPQRLWRIIQRAHQVSTDGWLSETGADFWSEIRSRAKTIRIVPSSTGQWLLPCEASIPPVDDENTLRLLESLNISVRATELSSHRNVLAALGAPALSLDVLVDNIVLQSPASGAPLADAPVWLSQGQGRTLRALYERLHAATAPEKRERLDARLRVLPLAIDNTGRLRAIDSVVRSPDRNAISLFEDLGTTIHFADSDDEQPFGMLIRSFSTTDALNALRTMDAEDLQAQFSRQPELSRELLGWFSRRGGDVRMQLSLFRSLPIIPCGESAMPLEKAAIPGNFFDRLGIATIVNVNLLDPAIVSFLIECGGTRLSLESYLVEHVPVAIAAGKLANPFQRRQLFRLVHEHIEEIVASPTMLSAVGSMPLVECIDGEFRLPGEVYLDEPVVRSALGNSNHIAQDSGPYSLQRQTLLILGVQRVPVDADVLHRIIELSTKRPDHETAAAMLRICEFMETKIHSEARTAQDEFYSTLRAMRWLPARGDGDRWYAPDELAACFQEFLFPKNTRFLAFERAHQQRINELLRYVGVALSPDVNQVLDYLLERIEHGQKPNTEAYRFLNRYAAEPGVKSLASRDCIWIESLGRFFSPSMVFWQNPFGHFRIQLGAEWRQVASLLSALDVHEVPDAEDAVRVLLDVSSLYGSVNSPLDDEAARVLHTAWVTIQSHLNPDSWPLQLQRTLTTLREKRVIANRQGILLKPCFCFFDDQPSLSKLFGDRLNNDLVTRNEYTDRAQRLAGVLSLSEGAQRSVAFKTDYGRNVSMKALLDKRAPHILRIARQANSPEVLNRYASLLATVDVRDVTELVVQYSVPLFKLSTEPHQYSACLDGGSLLIEKDAKPSWERIAREIVVAAEQTEDGACQRAVAVAAVLSAPTDYAATEILDNTGFALIDTSTVEHVQPVPAEFDVGDLETISLDNEENGAADSDVSVLDEPSAGNSKVVAAQGSPWKADMPQAGQDSAETFPKVKRGEKPQHSSANALRDQVARADIADSVGSRRDSFKSNDRRRFKMLTNAQSLQRSTRLISYVDLISDGKAAALEAERRQRRSSTARAAVARVLDYERAAGRVPFEMDFFNVGFDVRSEDSRTTRYIEVKGLAGEWTDLGVGISSAQFEVARDYVDEWWLYVVTFASNDDHATIYPIRNPTSRITNYRFDRGWKAASSPEPV